MKPATRAIGSPDHSDFSNCLQTGTPQRRPPGEPAGQVSAGQTRQCQARTAGHDHPDFSLRLPTISRKTTFSIPIFRWTIKKHDFVGVNSLGFHSQKHEGSNQECYCLPHRGRHSSVILSSQFVSNEYSKSGNRTPVTRKTLRFLVSLSILFWTSALEPVILTTLCFSFSPYQLSHYPCSWKTCES